MTLEFDWLHIVCLAISLPCAGLYVATRNWILNNLFAFLFSIGAIQLISLDSFKTGMILLAGLFVYDIFWVFGTEVMVSVAKNFDAPIKLLFPRQWTADPKFMMLGLGDIVLPGNENRFSSPQACQFISIGLFVALCLKFDRSRAGRSKKYRTTYFRTCLAFYVIGLLTTFAVMHTFQAAQVRERLLCSWLSCDID